MLVKVCVDPDTCNPAQLSAFFACLTAGQDNKPSLFCHEYKNGACMHMFLVDCQTLPLLLPQGIFSSTTTFRSICLVTDISYVLSFFKSPLPALADVEKSPLFLQISLNCGESLGLPV